MNERAVIGDNSGAFELREVAKDAIEAALRPLETRFSQLEASAERARADDDDTAARVVDLDAMLATLQDRIDDEHGRIKRPYLEAGAVVDGLANRLREKIAPIRQRLQAMQTAFLKAKQDKIDAERKAIAEAEAADPEPQWEPPVTRRAAVRGDYGAKAHLRTVDIVIVDDVKKVPKSVLEHPDVIAAIKKVAKPLLKAKQKVGGCRLETDDRASTKRN